MNDIFEKVFISWEVVGSVVGEIGRDWCLYNPIVFDLFDFFFIYLVYEAVVDGVCGLFFELIAVNNISQGHYIFLNSRFEGIILWIIHIEKSFIV